MATWNGYPKKFSMEVYKPGNHGYLSWEDVEFGWEYFTVSDYFRPWSKQDGEEIVYGDLLSNENAKAMLWCLAEWYNSYEGSEKLDELIQEIRKGRE